MAHVNNISLKSIKKFRGHEWEECLQGNIYLGNKKIGFWSQDSWGGPDMVHLDLKYSEEKFYEKCKELTSYDDMMLMEFLFADIAELTEIEKYFKKNVHEGQGLLVASDSGMRIMWIVNTANIPATDLVSTFTKNPKIKKELEKMNKEYLRVVCYTSLNDFDFGEHIEEKDILK